MSYYYEAVIGCDEPACPQVVRLRLTAGGLNPSDRLRSVGWHIECERNRCPEHNREDNIEDLL